MTNFNAEASSQKRREALEFGLILLGLVIGLPSLYVFLEQSRTYNFAVDRLEKYGIRPECFGSRGEVLEFADKIILAEMRMRSTGLLNPSQHDILRREFRREFLATTDYPPRC